MDLNKPNIDRRTQIDNDIPGAMAWTLLHSVNTLIKEAHYAPVYRPI